MKKKHKKTIKQTVQGKTAQELLFSALLTESSSIKREATLRRSPYNFETVAKAELHRFIESGYELDRESSIKAKIRKLKPIDQKLEDKFWFLLYKLGYSELNKGRDHKIVIRQDNAEDWNKQIDVFAKDSDTAIVAECKASASLTRRSLQKDIQEFASLKSPISKAINNHYGTDPQLKIIWIFVTDNIIWSREDIQRANGNNIQIITEHQLRYFIQIAEHLGPAAKYQFLAEFLRDQEIPALKGIKVPAIRGKLGGKKFYSFVVTPEHLLKIAFINHRSLQDPEGAPTYQRLVSRSRMTQIGRFIEEGGYFPTNILANFKSDPRFEIIKKDDNTDVTYGNLYLPSKYRSVWIIDGQHRLYGYANLEAKLKRQNIIVIAFAGMPKVEEANLFVTINHEQKTVPKTLLDDLEGELKWESENPQERIGAISSRAISSLNTDVGEPFYGRIARQGIKATERTCLTIPALKDGIRKSGLVGTATIKGSIFQPGPFTGRTDNASLDRLLTGLNGYFRLIRDANIVLWEMGRSGFLCTNVGIQAHCYLLGELIKYMETNNGYDAKEDLEAQEIITALEEYVEPVLKYLRETSQQKMVRDFKVTLGAAGPREYFYRLCNLIKQEFSDFTPKGLDEWQSEQSEDRVHEADEKIKEINIAVQSYIFKVFKKIYGIENNSYWEKGVTDAKIKAAAYLKSQEYEVEDRMPLENYLDFLNYMDIVKHPRHWVHFEKLFSIPEVGDTKQGKHLGWMEKINHLRRISAHPTELRKYKSEDFEYIDYIYEEFMNRYEDAKENLND